VKEKLKHRQIKHKNNVAVIVNGPNGNFRDRNNTMDKKKTKFIFLQAIPFFSLLLFFFLFSRLLFLSYT